jgi:hypothetical protein
MAEISSVHLTRGAPLLHAFMRRFAPRRMQ